MTDQIHVVKGQIGQMAQTIVVENIVEMTAKMMVEFSGIEAPASRLWLVREGYVKELIIIRALGHTGIVYPDITNRSNTGYAVMGWPLIVVPAHDLDHDLVFAADPAPPFGDEYETTKAIVDRWLSGGSVVFNAPL